MTFRLKDKNLQVQLDALSDGDFSKRLQHANHDDGMIFVEFGEKLESPGFDLHRFNLAFFDDEVEEIHRYNPHGWNAFPEVEPPEGVLMRVECNQMKTCLVFENGKWRYPSGESFENYEFAFPVKRFRPWDEDDEA
ncbi:MAG: hypothetical protein ACLT65_01520 [Sutterella wadsworthensis]|jgi:hypothetical protein|nr:MAG TPA: hypothetical protein [Caudoviricetes sp.]